MNANRHAATIKPAPLRPGVADLRRGGAVPPGPPGVDTVPAQLRNGKVLLDSPPEGPAEYVVPGDVMRAYPGLAQLLDGLRVQSHNPEAVQQRRATDGSGGNGMARGGRLENGGLIPIPDLRDTSNDEREFALNTSPGVDALAEFQRKKAIDRAQSYNDDVTRFGLKPRSQEALNRRTGILADIAGLKAAMSAPPELDPEPAPPPPQPLPSPGANTVSPYPQSAPSGLLTFGQGLDALASLPGYAGGGLVTRTDGSQVPLQDYVQEGRQRAIYGQTGPGVPPVSDAEMRARSAPVTQFDGNMSATGSQSNRPKPVPPPALDLRADSGAVSSYNAGAWPTVPAGGGGRSTEDTIPRAGRVPAASGPEAPPAASGVANAQRMAAERPQVQQEIAQALNQVRPPPRRLPANPVPAQPYTPAHPAVTSAVTLPAAPGPAAAPAAPPRATPVIEGQPVQPGGDGYAGLRARLQDRTNREPIQQSPATVSAGSVPPPSLSEQIAPREAGPMSPYTPMPRIGAQMALSARERPEPAAPQAPGTLTAMREDSNLRLGQPIDMKTLTPSDMSYLSSLQAAGGRARTDAKGNFQGYEMPPDGPVTAADLGRQVRAAGQPLNWDAFSPASVARARIESRPPSDYGNGMTAHEATLLRQMGQQQTNDLAAAKQYLALPANQRGPMPPAVQRAFAPGPTPADQFVAAAENRQMATAAKAKEQAVELGKEKIKAAGEMGKQQAAQANAWQNTLRTTVSGLAKNGGDALGGGGATAEAADWVLGAANQMADYLESQGRQRPAPTRMAGLAMTAARQHIKTVAQATQQAQSEGLEGDALTERVNQILQAGRDAAGLAFTEALLRGQG